MSLAYILSFFLSLKKRKKECKQASGIYTCIVGVHMQKGLRAVTCLHFPFFLSLKERKKECKQASGIYTCIVGVHMQKGIRAVTCLHSFFLSFSEREKERM